MPELPEAETIVRDLDRRLRGATLSGARVVHPDILGPGLSPRRLDRGVRGGSVTGAFRRGKNVVMALATPRGPAWIMINLGMTGRVVGSDSPRAAELSHIAVRFDLDDGRALLFDDTRRFGRVELLDQAGWNERDLALGVEPLSDAFTPESLYQSTRRSRTPIRNLLLDQSKVAGVGNIYANEALFRAGIRPTRRAHRVTRAQAAALHRHLRTVLNEAIQLRGTTFSDFRDADGNEGAFEPRLRVYGREGLPCKNCGAPIKRVVLTNRSAFYCPVDQR